MLFYPLHAKRLQNPLPIDQPPRGDQSPRYEAAPGEPGSGNRENDFDIAPADMHRIIGFGVRHPMIRCVSADT